MIARSAWVTRALVTTLCVSAGCTFSLDLGSGPESAGTGGDGGAGIPPRLDPEVNHEPLGLCDDEEEGETFCLDGFDNDCDGTSDGADPSCAPWVLDSDGDGVVDYYDCDPADETIGPDAEEVCDDGLDNNCDLVTDIDDPDCAEG